MVQRASEEQPEMMDQQSAAIPGGRLGDPEEIANAVVWLCSAESSYVMGHPLTIDGGLLVQ